MSDLFKKLGMSGEVGTDIVAEEQTKAIQKMREMMPLIIEGLKAKAELKRAEYESWVEAGFTEKQAMDIILKND